MRTQLIVGAVHVVAVLVGAACTGPPHSTPTPPAPSAPRDLDVPAVASTDLASPSRPVSAPASWPRFEPGPALPVSELPSDLINTPTPPSVTDARHSDEAGGDGADLDAPADVAATWTIIRSTSRFDDPAGDRRRRLGALVDDPSVAAASDLAAARADPVHGGATWAIVTAVAALGDGWWRVTYTLKQTRHGQLGGPTSTAATLDVHVNAARLVDAERP